MGINRYTFQARLVPVFILLLPIGLSFIAVFPVASLGSAISTLLGTLSLQTLATILLSELGRDAGKKKEPQLYARWGGMPTDLILSHRSTVLDHITVERYKNKLQTLLPGLMFPTPEQESNDSSKEMEVYRSCSNYLREHTRDKTRFSMLFAENASYGFRRNLWAMKPAGILIAMIGVAVCIVALGNTQKDDYQLVSAGVATILNVTLLTFWVLRFTPKWVKIPATEYAKQLFAACEIL